MKYNKKQAMVWRKAYEAGNSLDDLVAATCATERPVGHATIRALIISCGGKIRSDRAEAQQFVTRKRYYE